MLISEPATSAPPPDRSPVPGPGSVLLIEVGTDLFGLDVSAVREVVVAPKVTVLPTAPPTILGLFNLRGEVLPVLDTGRLLAGPGGADASFAVVVRCWDNDAALVVASLPTMGRIGAAIQASETAGTLGTYLVGDRLVTMVDPAELLAHAGLGVDPHQQPAG